MIGIGETMTISMIVMLLIMVGSVVFLVNWYMKEKGRHKTISKTLERQLRNKEISEEAYKKLLIELEDKSRDRI